MQLKKVDNYHKRHPGKLIVCEDSDPIFIHCAGGFTCTEGEWDSKIRTLLMAHGITDPDECFDDVVDGSEKSCGHCRHCQMEHDQMDDTLAIYTRVYCAKLKQRLCTLTSEYTQINPQKAMRDDIATKTKAVATSCPEYSEI